MPYGRPTRFPRRPGGVASVVDCGWCARAQALTNGHEEETARAGDHEERRGGWDQVKAGCLHGTGTDPETSPPSSMTIERNKSCGDRPASLKTG